MDDITAHPRDHTHERSSGERPRTAILVADGVEHIEVTAPRDALQAAGAEVELLSLHGSTVRTYHYLEPKHHLMVQHTLHDADVDAFDLVVVPGGLGSPDTLRTSREALDFVRAHASAGKPIGVICHGPWVLIDAGIVRGRSLTCVPALRSDIGNAGATYVDETVHVDRSESPCIISARNFEAARDFSSTLVSELVV